MSGTESESVRKRLFYIAFIVLLLAADHRSDGEE